MSASPLRVIFAGTPDFAARHLAALAASEHDILAVYTQPDRRAGRGRKLQASPVKQLALDNHLPCYQPPSLKDAAAREALAALGADILVVVAYGLILPQAVLDIPRRGCINVHASLLPRWRGAAPIQRAIEAGDERTGITIMQMDAGLDTGDMLAAADCAIDHRGHQTAAGLQEHLAGMGPPLLLEVLGDLAQYQAEARKQDAAGATYAAKIDKAEARLDWRRGVVELERRIRAFNPSPVCYGLLGGERVRIWEAWSLAGEATATAPGTIVRADDAGIVVNCGDGLLALRSVQLPGGSPLPAAEILKSRRALFAPGSCFAALDADGGG